MPNNSDSLLRDRIKHLEQQVETLTSKVNYLERQIDASKGSRISGASTKKHEVSRKVMSANDLSPAENSRNHSTDNTISLDQQAINTSKRRPMYALNSEEWLNRIGLGLLFLGMGLALKYTFDQQWFTAIPRVMSGSFVGLLLIAVGLHFHRVRPRFGQLLLGGGVATFYLTAFGAYQLYHLIPYSLAFVILFIITSLSFGLAAQRDDVLLAILATMGGLVTPFIMHSEGDNLLGLISYTSLILIGASAMYWFRGWRSLLFISSIGAWLVILVCYLNFVLGIGSIFSERWTLQSGLLIALLLFWVMPVVRGVLRSNNPEKWPAPPPVNAVGYFFNHPALPLSVTTPLTTLALSILIWNLSSQLWGWIILLSSSIFVFLYFFIRRKDTQKGLNHLAQMQGFTSILLSGTALFYLTEGYYLYLGLAVVATITRIVARLMKDKLFSITSHAIFLAMVSMMANRLLNMSMVETPFFNMPAATELSIIILVFVSGLLVTTKWISHIYKISAHLLFLGLIFREFYTLQDGQAVITTIWGIYSIMLLLLGLWWKKKSIRYAGMYTLTLVAVKLLLIDLEEVEPLIRILLFVGFGVIFMLLSYLVSSFFQKSVESHEAPINYQQQQEPERAVSE